MPGLCRPVVDSEVIEINKVASFSSLFRKALALIALLAFAAAGQTGRRVWSFAVAPIINDDAQDSGIVFAFEGQPCAAAAMVTVIGKNEGRPMDVTGTVETAPQRDDHAGANILRIPGGVKSAEALKIDSITVACGRYANKVPEPQASNSYPYCGQSL